MPHVLAMPAGQLRHPVAFLVAFESYDFSLHYFCAPLAHQK